MQFLKKYLKYWPTISALLGGLVTFLTPSMQAYIAANPKTATSILLALIIMAYHATAPKDQK